jgi:hypothetical protein
MDELELAWYITVIGFVFIVIIHIVVSSVWRRKE